MLTRREKLRETRDPGAVLLSALQRFWRDPVDRPALIVAEKKAAIRREGHVGNA